MDFSKKVVLVTGAGSGIGLAAAVQFGKYGAKVAVNSRTASHGEAAVELLKKAGAEGIFVQGDVSNPADAERIVKETVQAFGRIDILVNNAGIVLPGRVDNMSEEDFDKTMQVNVKGTFLVSKYAVLQMKKQGGGVIVNNGSVAALKGHTDRSAYSASKGAVVSLTKAMAADYINDNIRVNCVCPGTTYTQAIEEKIRNAADPAAMEAMFTARQPMGRLGRVEEIAHAILFACCDESAFMTGSLITIDGGMTM
ncbi:MULTISPECIES: SDR family NAD(P)-dependent oxidoreductase [Paenibacillus]|uniref:Short-chain dehydrogenase n=1 Tax=Paenibacillus naphthalenovorans TaxID=162209 RepID=A0A0U2UM67_9BACL|nr:MULTISPECIES: SDR family NAD(P)-dependent oxidoreductase [Paenibacillus]ALS23041.1 short-chain dehydrogenase [Paenibacillus naphthalenovorans]GCL71898.1 NAD(P)-dependent oxidoreductase [Paenibacillus naphthalenovorans]SDI41960.1 NAD(P)-dependent dehydrogenase, short-chain alcohol dehydrogenase family [Paenibacillus naphthalenovorans]